MDIRSLVPLGRSGGLLRGGNGDPFTSLRHEMDRLFDDFTQGWSVPALLKPNGFMSPKVDIAESDKGLELTAELPGVNEKDIDLDIGDGMLTLKAERKSEREEKDEKKHFHLVERSYGTYLRRFTLPFEVAEDKVDAKFEDGVLKVMIPRLAAAAKKTHKVKVKRAAPKAEGAKA